MVRMIIETDEEGNIPGYKKNKKKTPGFLTAKKIYTPSQYEESKQQQIAPKKTELRAKLRYGRENIKRFQAQRRYATSRTGRFGAALTRGIRAAQRPAPLRTALYSSSIPITSQNVQQEYPTMPRTLKGTSGGRPGRPRGTYDRRYSMYGGVYGYRKQLALQLRAKKLELMRRYQVSPQQQMVLNQVAASEQMQRQNPEGRIIPSTGGQVPMRGIFQEIEAACGIID